MRGAEILKTVAPLALAPRHRFSAIVSRSTAAIPFALGQFCINYLLRRIWGNAFDIPQMAKRVSGGKGGGYY